MPVHGNSRVQKIAFTTTNTFKLPIPLFFLYFSRDFSKKGKKLLPSTHGEDKKETPPTDGGEREIYIIYQNTPASSTWKPPHYIKQPHWLLTPFDLSHDSTYKLTKDAQSESNIMRQTDEKTKRIIYLSFLSRLWGKKERNLERNKWSGWPGAW